MTPSRPGTGRCGKHYKWMNLVAVAEIAIITVYFILPLYPSGWPGNDGLRVEVRELRTDPHVRLADPAGDLVGGLGQEAGSPVPKHTIDEDVIARLRGLTPGGTTLTVADVPDGELDALLDRIPVLQGVRREVTDLRGRADQPQRAGDHARARPGGARVPRQRRAARHRPRRRAPQLPGRRAGRGGGTGRRLPPRPRGAGDRLPAGHDAGERLVRRRRRRGARGRRVPSPARGPTLPGRLRHVPTTGDLPPHGGGARLPPLRRVRRARRRVASGCRPRWRSGPDPPCPATTTCWRATSSTTASGSG